MTVKEITDKLGLKVYTEGVTLDGQVKGGYVSDLLSDVMGHASEGEVWITLQSHLNVIAIASLKELAAVILVKDLQAGKDVLAKAQEEGIPVLGSGETTFEVAGILYQLLKG